MVPFCSQVLQPGVKGGQGVNLDMVRAKDDPTTFFNDGLRKIDFVLVYEETAKDIDEGLPENLDNAAFDPENIDQISK